MRRMKGNHQQHADDLSRGCKREEGEEGRDCFHKALVVSDSMPGDDEHGAGKAVLIGRLAQGGVNTDSIKLAVL